MDSQANKELISEYRNIMNFISIISLKFSYVGTSESFQMQFCCKLLSIGITEYDLIVILLLPL